MASPVAGDRARRGRQAKRAGTERERRTLRGLLPQCRAAHPDAIVDWRSSASRGPADVAAVCCLCGVVVMVQSKSNGWGSVAEQAELAHLAGRVRAGGHAGRISIELWRWDTRARMPRIRPYC